MGKFPKTKISFTYSYLQKDGYFSGAAHIRLTCREMDSQFIREADGARLRFIVCVNFILSKTLYSAGYFFHFLNESKGPNGFVFASVWRIVFIFLDIPAHTLPRNFYSLHAVSPNQGPAEEGGREKKMDSLSILSFFPPFLQQDRETMNKKQWERKYSSHPSTHVEQNI